MALGLVMAMAAMARMEGVPPISWDVLVVRQLWWMVSGLCVGGKEEG